MNIETVNRLREYRALLVEALEFAEGFEDGAPDASPSSKTANLLAYQIREALGLKVRP